MTNSTSEREQRLTPQQRIRWALEIAQKVCHGNFCDPHPMGQAEVCKAVTEAISLLDNEAAGGCGQCGGPHDFDTSVPSVVWNQVIRARGLPDYLCTTCIVREFVRVGQGFTAELWNEEFNGIPIEVVINGQNAKDTALIQEENNSLRNQINDAAQSIVNEADKVSQLMTGAATSMRDLCVERVKAMRGTVLGQQKQDHDPLWNISVSVYNHVLTELQSLTLDQVEQGK